MKRHLCAAALVAFLAAFSPGPSWAQETAENPEAMPETPAVMEDGSELWFAEFSSAPTADGGDLATILAEQATFRAAAGAARLRHTERKAFQTLWNGVSLALRPGEVAKLRRIPGVTAVFPVIAIEMPETSELSDPELATALAMTGANIVQNTLGFTGQGVKVAVMDTGIDYDHLALGGDGTPRTNSMMFPNLRVIAGTDFVGDAFTGSNTPVPDNYPDDCGGHGTHVAGIVGANGVVKGVAPNVMLGAYRVFGCSGSTTADIMIAAMERVLADGMQVLNMSIGSAGQWPQYPTAKASDNLVNRGVVVVASIGNSGTSGLYFGSAPGVGKKVIGVASFDNTHTNQPAFSISPDNLLMGYNGASGSPGAPDGTFPMARTGTVASTADACSPLPAGSLLGKIALIRRGTCTFHSKALNAQNAGAIGVVLYNNVAGNLSPTVVGIPPITIPVVATTAANGAIIDSRLASGPVDLTWGGGVGTVNATGGFISSFSSFGVAHDLSIKPDIGAPGGFILSTVPLETSGGIGQNSGTSMSSPHVAGSVALLLQAKPTTPSNAVRDILMNNATPRPKSSPAGLDNVHRQGAGMLDIAAAILATTRIEPGKLSLGEIESGSATRTLSIRNSSGSARTYHLSHEPALATGTNTFTPSFLSSPATVAFSANPVVVPANGTGTVDVTITPNLALAARSLFGGYIRFNPDDGGDDFRVSYAGFKGDYQSIPTLTSGGASNFPWLARLVGSSFFNQPAGATYTLQGGDVPYILLHLDHAVNELRFEVFDANTGDSWHRAFRTKHFRRSTGPTSFFSFAWDGQTLGGNKTYVVPNGQYRINVLVVKALGEEGTPGHTENWMSPVITIARPSLVAGQPFLSQNVVQAGDNVLVSANVANLGSAVEGVTVDFRDNGASFGSTTVDLGAGESRLVGMPWLVGSETTHLVQVVVDPDRNVGEYDYGDNTGSLTVILGQTVGVGGNAPAELSFAPASRNPFRGSVAFRLGLPREGPVGLEVFDMAGRRLQGWRWSVMPAGEHTLSWDGRTESGRDAPAGLLMFRLTAMGRTLTHKAVRLP